MSDDAPRIKTVSGKDEPVQLNAKPDPSYSELHPAAKAVVLLTFAALGWVFVGLLVVGLAWFTEWVMSVLP